VLNFNGFELKAKKNIQESDWFQNRETVMYKSSWITAKEIGVECV